MDTNAVIEAEPLISPPELNATDTRTLGAIFRHPVAHNLDWNDVEGFFVRCGSVEHSTGGAVTLVYASQRHHMGLHRSKQLDTAEIIDLRRFLSRAGWGVAEKRAEVAQEGAASDDLAPDLLVVVDHRETRIYRVHGAGSEVGPVLTPYDPHHFLHHLEHRNEPQERGQRSPEDPGYYRRIAEALAHAGRIVLVGHGTGKSNAAHHLADTLKAHHAETYGRIAAEFDEDLSCVTVPQLLRLAQKSLH